MHAFIFNVYTFGLLQLNCAYTKKSKILRHNIDDLDLQINVYCIVNPERVLYS